MSSWAFAQFKSQQSNLIGKSIFKNPANMQRVLNFLDVVERVGTEFR